MINRTNIPPIPSQVPSEKPVRKPVNLTKPDAKPAPVKQATFQDVYVSSVPKQQQQQQAEETPKIAPKPLNFLSDLFSLKIGKPKEQSQAETVSTAYQTSFKDENGVVYGKNKVKKHMFNLIKGVAEGEIPLDSLSDEQILDIWSWRMYDIPLQNHPETQQQFIERFNNICKNNIIRLKDGETLIRTIPVEIDCNGEFSIGKPSKNSKLGNWPAAAARMTLGNDEELPEGLIRRIRDDKLHAISNLSIDEDKIPSSMVFVIDSDDAKVLQGFDWESTGVVDNTQLRSGFGSPAFRKEVDPGTGLSTEVNFPSDAKFILNPDKEVITISDSITIPKDGQDVEYPYSIKIVHIMPKQ